MTAPPRRAVPRYDAGSLRLAVTLVGFCIGAAAAHAWPWRLDLGPWCVGCGALLLCDPRLRVAGAALAGYGWVVFAISVEVTARAQPCDDALAVTVRIASFPKVDDVLTRFDAEVLSVDTQCRGLIGRRARLVWFDAPGLALGEVWRLDLTQRKARGLVNVGAYDYERWLFRHRVLVSGAVRGGSRLGAAGAVSSLRERIRSGLQHSGLEHAPILAALTVGDSSGITLARWDALRRTGTVHLVVISGLHVGTLALIGALIGAGIVRLTLLNRRFSPRGGAAIAGICLLVPYVLVAGAGLPVVRAGIMASTAMGFVALGRSASVVHGFLIALALVVFFDPLAPLDPGVWLSFGAVFLLLGYSVPRIGGKRWRTTIGAQWLLWFGLAPIVMNAAGALALAAPVANLIVVPIVTFVVVPLALLAGLLIAVDLPPLAALELANAAMAFVLFVIDGFAQIPTVAYGAGVISWPAILSVALVILPNSRTVRVVGALTVIGILTQKPPPPEEGEFAVTIVDVGQGTAVVVQTALHVLLYDAGARFASGFDLGEAAVSPSLRALGVGSIDAVMLSHADIDHVGGLESVLADYGVARLLAGEPVTGHDTESCHAGQRWRWDGVSFHVLHPRLDGRPTGNRASCVLLIENGVERVLLAGDLERDGEAALGVDDVSVLLVPHHGSRTSSSRSFLRRARPRFAVVSAGFRNRYGHPHVVVVERYRDFGVHLVSTAANGALYWRSDDPYRIDAARCGAGHWVDGRRSSYAGLAPRTARAPEPANALRSQMLPCRGMSRS